MNLIEEFTKLRNGRKSLKEDSDLDNLKPEEPSKIDNALVRFVKMIERSSKSGKEMPALMIKKTAGSGAVIKCLKYFRNKFGVVRVTSGDDTDLRDTKKEAEKIKSEAAGGKVVVFDDFDKLPEFEQSLAIDLYGQVPMVALVDSFDGIDAAILGRFGLLK